MVHICIVHVEVGVVEDRSYEELVEEPMGAFEASLCEIVLWSRTMMHIREVSASEVHASCMFSISDAMVGTNVVAVVAVLVNCSVKVG